MVTCKEALQTVLDCVDYTKQINADGVEYRNCLLNEMVGAVLPEEIIFLAWEAIKEEEESE